MIVLVATAAAFSSLDTCDGMPTHRPSAYATWRLSSGGGSVLPGATDAWVVDQNNAAWEAWADPTTCCSAVHTSYGGPTPVPFAVLDGIDVVAFETDAWHPAFGSPDTTAAVTVAAYGSSSCTVTGADQLYNAVAFDLADPLTVDLRGLMTHENGHWLGIDHTDDHQATMAMAFSGTEASHTLTLDDANAVCTLQPGCDGAEVCDNGLDDDENGLRDCADPACDGFLACTCRIDGLIERTVKGSTATATATVDRYACTGALPGPERSYTWLPPADGRLTVQLTDLQTADLTLIVGTESDGLCSGGACSSSPRPGLLDEVVERDVRMGEPVQITVDGVEPAGAGFSLSTAFTPDAISRCAEPAPAIGCDARVEGTNLDGPRHHATYGCSDWETAGQEALYTFRSDTDTEVTIALTHLAADLDLFVTEATSDACEQETCVAASGRDALADETVVFDAVAGVPYRIVADAFDDQATTPFVLTVACETAPTLETTGCSTVPLASGWLAIALGLLTRRRG